MLVAKMKHMPTEKYACEICERTFRKSQTLRLHIRQDHKNGSDDEGHEMEITDDDVNHEENEDDKAGYKSNDEGSMNEDKTVE